MTTLKPTRRARIERWLNEIWYERKSPPWYLRALVPIYRGLRVLDRLLSRRSGQRLRQKVWVVGNLTVGGSGKTPLVIWLVQQAQRHGIKVGVISRGYGGSHSVPTLVFADSDWKVCGDEPVLIAKATGAPVAVAKHRLDAAKLLDSDCELLICDDGLQHQALPRDLEILVIDGSRRFGNAHLLPAGPLREPAVNLSRFTARVCNGGIAQPGEYLMLLSGAVLINLASNERRALAEFHGQSVRALAGIGNPERFYSSLRAAGLLVDGIATHDHAVVTAEMLAFTGMVLMTEKDALKCAHLDLGTLRRCWVLPVSAGLSDELWKVLQQTRLG